MVEFYEKMIQLMKEGKKFVLVKVVDKKGATPCDIGAAMLVMEDGKTIGTIGGGNLEFEGIKEAKKRMKELKNGLKEYNLDSIDMLCGGSVQLYFEVFKGRSNVYIFGLGHIGYALIYHLKNLDYNPVIIDIRNSDFEDYIKVNDYSEFIKDKEIKEDDFVVITTYSHDEDFKILKEFYKRKINVRYIGVVASRKKINTFKEQLRRELGVISFENLYSPAGLDIGGITPDEIAISIIAEMQTIKNNKQEVRHLRDDILNNR